MLTEEQQVLKLSQCSEEPDEQHRLRVVGLSLTAEVNDGC